MRFVSCFSTLTLLLLAVFCNIGVSGSSLSTTVNWISTTGLPVVTYGSDPALGWLRVFACTGAWAKGWTVFSVPPCAFGYGPPPSFNFTVYVARIVNASIIELDCNGSDLLIRGFWEVNSGMNPATYTDFYGLLENMSVKAGELSIMDNWYSFIINIEGYESIYGNITSHFVGDPSWSWRWGYPYGDYNDDGMIDMRDIGGFARAFGAGFGSNPRYAFRADINFDFKVDMRDIAVCARRFGWS